jgi:DegV family protein with EDD domain
MSGVGLILDSASNLPVDEFAPVKAVFLGHSVVLDLAECGELPLPEFLERVQKSKTKPTTSALRVDEFASAAAKLFESGCDGVVIVLSARALSDLSHQAAERAAMDLGGARAVILDTCTNSGASAAIALEVARCAASGLDVGQVKASASALIPRAMAVTAIPAPETFKRGGRMGDATPLADRGSGSIAIIAMRGAEGRVAPLGKVDSVDEAQDMMRDALRDFVRSTKAEGIRVVGKHALGEERAARLVDGVSTAAECVSTHIVPFHNSVAAHLGAGAWSAGVLALET